MLDGTGEGPAIIIAHSHGAAVALRLALENPKLVREGQDPQLERAVQVALGQIKAHPPEHYRRPPWRNYHPKVPPLPQPTSVGD